MLFQQALCIANTKHSWFQVQNYSATEQEKNHATNLKAALYTD